MRNITFDAINAFDNSVKFNSSNTKVIVNDNRTLLQLFGNTIAGKEFKGFFVDACNELTNTTKERLNGLTGVSIQQKKSLWYLNGQLWNGQKIYINS